MAYATDPKASSGSKPKPKPASKPNQPKIVSKQVFTDFAAI